MTQRGIFITFEGSEGCGKTTQIQRLRASLETLGREVVVTREPGGTPVGEQVRHTLQHARESENMTPEAELLLFAASRAQLVREKILPALEAGIDVLSDRFLDSTTVYQGVARRLAKEDVAVINRFAVGGHLPDVTFVLDLDASTSLGRLNNRSNPKLDRIEREPIEFFERVRQGYLDLAASDPGRFQVLDASQPPEVIAGIILNHVQELLHGLHARTSA